MAQTSVTGAANSAKLVRETPAIRLKETVRLVLWLMANVLDLAADQRATPGSGGLRTILTSVGGIISVPTTWSVERQV